MVYFMYAYFFISHIFSDLTLISLVFVCKSTIKYSILDNNLNIIFRVKKSDDE